MTDLYSAELAKKQELVAICDTLKARVVELEAENERLAKHAYEQRSRRIAEWDEIDTLATRVAELEACGDVLEDRDEMLDRIAELEENMRLHVDIAADALGERDRLKDGLATIKRQAEDATEFVLASINAEQRHTIDTLKTRVDWAERLAKAVENHINRFKRMPDNPWEATDELKRTLAAYREAKP